MIVHQCGKCKKLKRSGVYNIILQIHNEGSKLASMRLCITCANKVLKSLKINPLSRLGNQY